MTSQVERRSSHPYYMHDAVHGQPDAIARVLDEEKESVTDLAERMAPAERVHVVGIGTSWHASLVGEHLLRSVGGREEARAWNSLEFCTYPPALTERDAVVVMSHRGTKRYSARALELARANGATTAVVTGIGSDARTDLADVVVRTSERDPSSAFTTSHTAAMTVLAMLSAELGARAGRAEGRGLQRSIADLPQLVRGALDQEGPVRQWAEESVERGRLYFAGWGPNASTAYEVALKIKESSYGVAEGFQLEQYLHGPFVATAPDTMVTFIAPPGGPQQRAADLIGAATAVGADTACLVERGDETLTDLVRTPIYMPQTLEALTPIVYLVALQLFTYWLALGKGRNPDTFRLDDPDHAAARQNYEL